MPLPVAPTKLGDRVKLSTESAVATTHEPVDSSPTVTSEVNINTEALTTTSKRRTRKKVAPKVEVNQSVTIEGKAHTEGKSKTSHLRGARASVTTQKPRIFVLDTNVLLHDPMSLFRFQEHDVFLPMTTLEELDNHKKGSSDLARSARQVSRSIDQLIESHKGPIAEGVPLNACGQVDALGKLFFETTPITLDRTKVKADNIILASVQTLAESHPELSVVLVSKDINMRIKATAIGLAAEDYFSDKTLDDTDLLWSGYRLLPEDFWSQQTQQLESWNADGRAWYRCSGPLAQELTLNEFVATETGSFFGQVVDRDANTVTLTAVTDYMQPKNSVWGIHARNMEQSMAFNLLMNPEIDFVSLLGQAGTGKTLLALAAALALTLDERRYTGVIFTRATVSVGEDIGFLPGTEEEKMTPWMGAVEDNLEVLNQAGRNGAGQWGRDAANDLIRSRIQIKSMSFMRGRTFQNKLLIIDEAQNLTPKQMKTLITRAGPGTKIVCLGNIAQIDTPYLTEGSSGLTYVVERFRGWKHAGHITLRRGERSRLAEFASTEL